MMREDVLCAAPAIIRSMLRMVMHEGKHGSTAAEAGMIPESTRNKEVENGNGGQTMDEIINIMALIQPELDASLAEGTKRQKSMLSKYWKMNCAEIRVDMQKLTSSPQGSENEAREA